MARRETKQPRTPGRWPIGASIAIHVTGIEPVPKGSMSAFVPIERARAALAMGRAPTAIITDQKGDRLVAYEQLVSLTARQKLDAARLPCAQNQPFAVVLGFYMPRPKDHFATGGHLKPSAPVSPWKGADLDKLVRSTLDALTGLAWDDDSRVVRIDAEEFYATPRLPTGVWIKLTVRGATVRECAQANIAMDALR